jgi:threonine/homoserine/homoserine lactone efflux protein
MVSKEKMEEYFNNGIFLIAMIFMFVAVVSLYFSIGTLIGNWLDYRYRPIFDIAFSLSVLIICIYLIREKLTKSK